MPSLNGIAYGAVHVQGLAHAAVLFQRLHDAVHHVAGIGALPEPGIAVAVMVID